MGYVCMGIPRYVKSEVLRANKVILCLRFGPKTFFWQYNSTILDTYKQVDMLTFTMVTNATTHVDSESWTSNRIQLEITLEEARRTRVLSCHQRFGAIVLPLRITPSSTTIPAFPLSRPFPLCGGSHSPMEAFLYLAEGHLFSERSINLLL